MTQPTDPRRNFAGDLQFLSQHVATEVLQNSDGAAVIVVPAWQGRTMTSTTCMKEGISFGWINDPLIASGKTSPVVNLYGGEDRFWLSPEGSQYSLFFDPGAPMLLENWRCPPLIDTTPFEIANRTATSILTIGSGNVTNYAETRFDLRLEREVVLHERQTAFDGLGAHDDGNLKIVGHESRNRVVNIGDREWTPSGGLLAVWILAMNKPAPGATVVIPFDDGKDDEPVLTSDYFGPLDSTRLQIDHDKKLVFFLGDGSYRSKLGLTAGRSTPWMGSWDPVHSALTVVWFSLPEDSTTRYTNNLWKRVSNPYSGDAINSYNDGPNEMGGILGPFYELETLSPALELAPRENYVHVHKTWHLQGPIESLDKICNTIFGVPVSEIARRFNCR